MRYDAWSKAGEPGQAAGQQGAFGSQAGAFGSTGVRSVDLVSVVRLRLRLVLVSRHRLLRLLDKLKLLHHSAVVVSAQQRHLVALDRVREHPRSVAVAVAVREAVYLVNRLQPGRRCFWWCGRSKRRLRRRKCFWQRSTTNWGCRIWKWWRCCIGSLAFWSFCAIGRYVWESIATKSNLCIWPTITNTRVWQSTTTIWSYSVLNLPLHLPEDPLEVHCNSQVVGVDYLGPRERRQEVPAVLALLLHQLQVSVGSALHKDNNNNNNKMLLVSHNLLGEAICLERSKTKAVAGSLIKAVNNLDLGPRQATPGFGAPQQQQGSTGGLFGANPAQTGGIKGGCATTATGSHEGGGAQTSPAGGQTSFGAAPSTGTGGLFGAKPAGSPGGLFGGGAQQPSAGGAGLGGAPAGGVSGGSSLFPSQTPTQGAGGGLFGGIGGGTQAGGSSLFAPKPATGTTTGGLFGGEGSTQPQSTPSTSHFGAPTSSTPSSMGGGLFSSQQQQPGQQTSLFGGAKPAGGGLFGNAPGTGGGLQLQQQQQPAAYLREVCFRNNQLNKLMFVRGAGGVGGVGQQQGQSPLDNNNNSSNNKVKFLRLHTVLSYLFLMPQRSFQCRR